jgi:hypothetical protein
MRALAALTVLSLAGCMGLAQRGNVVRANNAMSEGNWAKALYLSELVITDGRADRQAQLDAYFIKAQVLEHQGRKREPQGLYEYLVEAGGSGMGGAQARARLAALGGAVCPAVTSTQP